MLLRLRSPIFLTFIGAGLGACGAATCSSSEKPKSRYHSETTTSFSLYEGRRDHSLLKSLKVFATNSNPELMDDISKYIGVSAGKATVSRFKDGETAIQVHESVSHQDVYVVGSTTSSNHIMELLLTTSALRRDAAKKITAIMPFYGYARQDRKEGRKRQPISAADIALMLTEMGVDRVVAVDMHSGQIQGFFPPSIPVDNIGTTRVAAQYFHERLGDLIKDPVLVSPHGSGIQRALNFRDALSRLRHCAPFPFVMLEKVKRVSPDDQEDTIDVNCIGAEEVKGRDCIIVDDLVDTGRTLERNVRKLKACGARTVMAYATHGRFSGDGLQRIEALEELDLLVVTDTLPTPAQAADGVVEMKRVKRLSIAPLLAEVVMRLHTKRSMGRLLYSDAKTFK